MKICWNITNRCNLDCKHCFRDKVRQEISLEDNLLILHKIAGFVDEISFSGGEVFLYKDFVELLKEAKKLGKKCSLTTNALLLNQDLIREVMKYLDRITFSLDYACDLDNMNWGRGTGYINHLREVVRTIKSIDYNFPIKLNTVVTSKNKDDLKQIQDFAISCGIQTWQVMRYCPYRQDDSHMVDELEISNAEFEMIRANLKSSDKLNVVVKDIIEIENQFVIAPNGDLVIGQNNKDEVILTKLQNQDIDVIKDEILETNNEDNLNINLNLYKAFFYVAKTGSINSAANKMLISQPAISKAIKKIESELNVKLFDRTNNGMVLTNQGQNLFARVEMAYNEIVTAERSIRDGQSFARGFLRIGAPSHIASFLVFDKVKDFKRKYPNIRISIMSRPTKDLLEMLNKHEIDFIIDSVPVNFDDKNITIKKITTVEHCFVVSEKLKDEYVNIRNIKSLQNAPLILPVGYSTHRKKLNAIFEHNNMIPQNVLSLETSEMIVDAVMQCLGVGYILHDFVKEYLDANKFFELQLNEDLPKIDICLLYFDKYLSNIPKYFIENYILNN